MRRKARSTDAKKSASEKKTSQQSQSSPSVDEPAKSLQEWHGQDSGTVESERRQVVEQWLAQDRPLSALETLTDLTKFDPDECALWDAVAKYTQSARFLPRPNTTWRDYAAEALRKELEIPHRLLQLLSKRDVAAAEFLVDFAVQATQTLTDLAISEPKKIRPIAARRFLWPFLHGQKNRYSDKYKGIIKSIGLAAKAPPFSLEKLGRTPENSATSKLAMGLLCKLQNHLVLSRVAIFPDPEEWQIAAANLKPFTIATFKDWAAIAWLLLNFENGGHPEKNSKLRAMGNYRIDHRQNFKGTITPERGILDGIKESLQKEIKRLAEVNYLPK